MPRQARKRAESGIYHVMLRGINHQQIFMDREDNKKFLLTIRQYKPVCSYKILAYCLMGNHIHILLREGTEPLEQVFKRIGSSFVYWYNARYQRTGHLFQDRFKSEPVEDDAYLLTVIRYIHQNPVKAGLCQTPEEYPYSSWREYLGKPWLTDVDETFKLIELDDLIAFHRILGEEECLEEPPRPAAHVTDVQAVRLMEQLTGCKNASEFQRLNPAARDRAILALRDNHLSVRQISRLTGSSMMVVRNARG